MSSATIVVDTRDKLRGNRPDPSVPFQRFYLVPPDVMPSIQRMVPFAIVVPLSLNYETCLQRQGLDTKALIASGYQVVVPVAMTRLRTVKGQFSSDEVKPTYIAGPKWMKKSASLAPFIPEDVTLVTPSGLITPMCIACEWSLRHLSGECTLGSKHCLEHMRITNNAMNEREVAALEQGGVHAQ